MDCKCGGVAYTETNKVYSSGGYPCGSDIVFPAKLKVIRCPSCGRYESHFSNLQTSPTKQLTVLERLLRAKQ